MAERRKSEPFFRKAHDYLANLSIEKLVEPEFNSNLGKLIETAGLLLRISTLLTFYREAFSRQFNGSSVSELEGWVDEMTKLEAGLLARRIGKKGQGVVVSLATAREVISVYLQEKKRGAQQSARGGFSRQADDSFQEDSGFAQRNRTSGASSRAKAAADFEDDGDFVAAQWQTQQQKREAKKQRNMDRAELLRDLTEKMKQFRTAQTDEPKKTQTSAKAPLRETGIQAEFSAARMRAKVHAKRSVAWAVAFLNLSANVSLADAKATYYELAKRWHPDVHPKEMQSDAQEAMVWLNDAWKILRHHLQTKK